MPWWVSVSLIVNAGLVGVGIGAFVAPGAHFSVPWDGPAIATLLLAAATLILTAVAVMAGFLVLLPLAFRFFYPDTHIFFDGFGFPGPPEPE